MSEYKLWIFDQFGSFERVESIQVTDDCDARTFADLMIGLGVMAEVWHLGEKVAGPPSWAS